VPIERCPSTGWWDAPWHPKSWCRLLPMSWEKKWDEMPVTEQRLYLAAQDGTELGHITWKEREHQPDGTVKEYPPRDPAECSQILLRWLGLGLIEVYRVLAEAPWYEDVSGRRGPSATGRSLTMGIRSRHGSVRHGGE
jgi:hypothetical protein